MLLGVSPFVPNLSMETIRASHLSHDEGNMTQFTLLFFIYSDHFSSSHGCVHMEILSSLDLQKSLGKLIDHDFEKI